MDVSMKPKLSLSRKWYALKQDYKLIEVLGVGSFGEVLRAKHRKSGKDVAIKFMKTRKNCIVTSRYIIRELSLLRQLKLLPNNVFTTELYDIETYKD